MNWTIVHFVLIVGLVCGQDDFQVSYVIEQMDRYCELRHSGIGARTPAQSVAETRVGKAGPRGPRGVPGPAAEVDYPRIESVIDQKLQALQTQMAEMEKMHEQQMTEMRNKFQLQVRLIRRGLCEVEYQGKCFWAIKTNEHAAQARELCEAEGGNAANIYDATNFEKIRTYLLTLFGNEQYVYTGMNFVPQTRTITFVNGTASTFEKWHRGYPSGQGTVIVFDVRSDPNDHHSGFWNSYGSDVLQGVICEI